MSKSDWVVGFAAQTKQYMVYGASLTAPFFTLITFLGVVKMAWNIPTEIAAVLAFGGVYTIGYFSFKTGLYAKDQNITWKNTPMAVDIHERTGRIDENIKHIDESIEKLNQSLNGEK